MALSKRVRFEVFKRDKFTCQYCGRKAPDVVLQCDHIEPSSQGGNDELLNLTTSCFDCNQGKKDKRLSDDSVVAQQRKQLEDLQERQEQIRMMIEWQRSLVDTEGQAVDEAASFWCTLAGWYGVTEDGKADLRKLVRKHGIGEVVEAMRQAVDYFKYDDDGNPTDDSTNLGFDKIGGIIRIKHAEEEKPWLRDLFYTRGVLRKRCEWYNGPEAYRLLERAYELGIPTDVSRDLAYKARTYGGWKSNMIDLLSDYEEEGDLG